MITSAPHGDAPGTSKVKPKINLPIMLSVLYAFGLFGFFQMLRKPLLYGMAWDQGTALTVLSCGGIIGAAFLILASRAIPAKPLKNGTSAIVATVFALLSVGLFAASSLLPSHSLNLEMCALFFTSCGVPFAVLAWVVAYGSLSFRDVLLNSGVAYAALVLLQFVATGFFAEYYRLICSVFLLAGTVASFLFRYSSALPFGGIATGGSEEGDADKDVAPRRFFVSVPFAGLVLYAITTGLVLGGTSSLTYPLLIGSAVFLVMAFVVVLSFTKFSRMPDHQLTFYLYGFGLPAIAVLAFFIKMIPIDIIASELFRELMKVYFQLILLAAWTYLVNYVRINSNKVPFVCGVSQAVISLSFLTGNLIRQAGSPLSTTTLGLITAGFLLFAIVTVGRNFISFAKGPETAEELVKIPLDMEAVCAIVSAEYKLSPRETEVLRELAYGHSSSYVAKVLIISNNTARTHMKNIYKKLAVGSREELLELLRNKQKPSA